MDKDYLTQVLSIIALYICIYENFVETTVSRVESFLCTETDRIQNGKVIYQHSDLYKEEIRNKIVDEKGNKNITKATVQWFLKLEAIDQDDYHLFMRLKDLRNSFVHDLADHVWKGVSDNEIQSLFRLFELSKKIDLWRINEIKIPILGEFELNEKELVSSMDMIVFKRLIQTLFGKKNNSDKEISMAQKVRNYE